MPHFCTVSSYFILDFFFDVFGHYSSHNIRYRCSTIPKGIDTVSIVSILFCTTIPFAVNQNLSVFYANTKRSRCAGCPLHALGVLRSPQVHGKLINRAPNTHRMQTAQRVSGALMYTTFYIPLMRRQNIDTAWNGMMLRLMLHFYTLTLCCYPPTIVHDGVTLHICTDLNVCDRKGVHSRYHFLCIYLLA